MSTTFRLYMDESGDHKAACPGGIGQRYLGLVGLMLPGVHAQALVDRVDQFKRSHLEYDPDDPPILHREDIIQRRGPFKVLTDPGRRQSFGDGIIELIRATPIRVVCVVVDKQTHGLKKYRQLTHPYHYCLVAMLERYCGWLAYTRSRGDVMAESRGGTEDRLLGTHYEQVYNAGTVPYLP